MPRSLISLGLLALTLALAPIEGSAQDIGGNLEGTAIDSAGRSLSGVEIEVDGTGLPGTRITRTNPKGRFRLEQLPVGSYRVRYRFVGYQPAAVTGIVVRLGTTTSVPTVTLGASTFALEEITVMAERPLLDPASTTGGGDLTAERFDDLPTDRNYRTLPLFLPGVTNEVEGINFEGATGMENQFYVDGANVTDMATGTASMLLPPNFVQEVRVRTGGYEAEYRSTLGGIVDVVTRSGGDQFQGQVFGTATGDALTGTPRAVEAGTSPGGFAKYDMGASLSGPIVRGQLWFFGAYSRFTERDETVVPGYDDQNARRFHNSYAGKFTWQPGPRTTVITSFLGDPTTERVVDQWNGPVANLDALLGHVTSGFLSGSVNATHTVSPRLLLTGSASWVHQRYDVKGATARGRGELWFSDTNNVLSGGFPGRGGSTDTRLTAAISASYLAGGHQLKAGFEYAEQRLDQAYVEQQVFHNRPAPPEQPTDYYQLASWHPQGNTESRLPSVFTQDAWSPGRHVTLNLGLRWDGQYLIGSDGHISLAVKDQWQPRVGIILRPDQAGQQRVFASWGRFYQEIQQTLGGLYYAYGSTFGISGCSVDPRIDATTCDPPGQVFSRIPDPRLKGQSFDEWSAGYERALSRGVTARARGVHRHFNWGIEDSQLSTGDFALGNPGRGQLSDYPKMRRDYTGLELSMDGPITPRLWVLTSYVLSRTYGNYSGLYNSDEDYVFPNVNGAFDIPEILVNSTGLLANDRPHVFKLNAAYRLPAGLSAGTSFVLQSGTPRNVLGPIPGRLVFYHGFVVRRGTAGRTPTNWDLNLRLAWSLDEVLRTAWQQRLVLDLYHVGSPQEALAYDDVKYLGVDSLGNLTSPNPHYGKPTRFQPPMAARLGLTLNF